MSNTQQPRGSVAVFGCGGGGINLVLNQQLNTPRSVGEADLHLTYVDTSLSNMRNVDLDQTFVLEGVDGSGKDRKRNVEQIAREVPRLLNRFPAKDLNIVVFTGAGGTGSVAGPLLIRELLKQDKMVVGIMVGSLNESIRSAGNTFETFQTHEKTIKQTDRNVVLAYLDNEKDGGRKAVNTKVGFLLATLAILGSRQNHGLDTADLEHWLQYHKVTTTQPQLSLLQVTTEAEELRDQDILSLAALYVSEDKQPSLFRVPYLADGYLPEDAPHQDNFFFGISTRQLPGLLSELKKTADENQRLEQQVQAAPSFGGDDDTI